MSEHNEIQLTDILLKAGVSSKVQSDPVGRKGLGAYGMRREVKRNSLN